MINAHINCGDIPGGAAMFAQMREAGLKPNVIVYTTLLKGTPRTLLPAADDDV